MRMYISEMRINCAGESGIVYRILIVDDEKIERTGLRLLLDKMDQKFEITEAVNGKEALEWKLKYIDAFNKMEAFIQERRSSEWLLTRKQGKLIRRCETDMLANLVEYAESQGSRNMRGKVYTVYSKLINDLVGIQSGQRDSVPFKTISVIAFLEDMVLHTVEEEMKKGTHYKDIYQLCKKNGEQIMRFAYLPKFAEKAS